MKQELNMVSTPPEKRHLAPGLRVSEIMAPGVLIKRAHEKWIKGAFDFILKIVNSR